MGYFAAYWEQIKGFYHQMNIALFTKDRDLDGDLNHFVMKPGFFWELVALHWILVKMVGRFFIGLFQLAFGYVAMALISLLLISAPLVIFVVFPLFVYNRRRRLKLAGERL